MLGLQSPSSDVEREAATDQGLQRERQKEDERAAVVENREEEYNRFKRDIVENTAAAPINFVKDKIKKLRPGSS